MSCSQRAKEWCHSVKTLVYAGLRRDGDHEQLPSVVGVQWPLLACGWSKLHI